MMLLIRSIMAFSALMTLGLPMLSEAQTFEGMSSLSISGGISIPAITYTEKYNTGPFGRVSLVIPATPTIHIGVEAGVSAPTSETGEYELLQIPLRLLAIFPKSAKAASTPFLAIGGGATIINEEIIDHRVANFFLSYSRARAYPAYNVQLGYRIRPESMAGVLFDIYVRFEQHFIDDRDDFRNIDIGLGIGLYL